MYIETVTKFNISLRNQQKVTLTEANVGKQTLQCFSMGNIGDMLTYLHFILYFR